MTTRCTCSCASTGRVLSKELSLFSKPWPFASRSQSIGVAPSMLTCRGGDRKRAQELESARGKMLREMCRLHAELSGCDRPRSSPAAAGPTGTMPSLPSVPGRNIASSKLPSPVRNSSSRGNPGARSAVPSSTKGSPLTPFLTCLSAKPREQQMEALSAIKSARESIERAAEERAYRDSWCRWIISALEAENSRDPSSAGGVKGTTGSMFRRPGGQFFLRPVVDDILAEIRPSPIRPMR